MGGRQEPVSPAGNRSLVKGRQFTMLQRMVYHHIDEVHDIGMGSVNEVRLM